MVPVALSLPVGQPVPTPGVGPDELLEFWPDLVRAGWFLAGFLVVTLVGWYVVEPAISRAIRRRNRNNPTVQEAIRRYVRLVVVLVAIVVGASLGGYGRFLTNSAIVVAAGTLAVGVAGQSVLGSLVSGLALVVDPEFNVGDYIEWEDAQGTIRSITLRVTRVQTPDGELVTIPNTVLTGQAVTRPFGRGRYRIVQRVDLDYDDDVDEAVGQLEEIARDLEGVLTNPSPSAFVDEFGDDAVVASVYYWIEDPSKRDVVAVSSRFRRRVMDRFEAEAITIGPAAKRDLEGRIEIAEPP